MDIRGRLIDQLVAQFIHCCIRCTVYNTCEGAERGSWIPGPCVQLRKRARLKRTRTSLLCPARWARGMLDEILQPLSRAWRGCARKNLGWRCSRGLSLSPFQSTTQPEATIGSTRTTRTRLKCRMRLQLYEKQLKLNVDLYCENAQMGYSSCHPFTHKPSIP